MKKKVKKNGKQKSFFFEDYKESEIVIDNKSNLAKVSLNRTTFLVLVFLSLIAIFCIKIIYLSLFPEKNVIFDKVSSSLIKTRADILDRNGNIIAKTVNTINVGITAYSLRYLDIYVN